MNSTDLIDSYLLVESFDSYYDFKWVDSSRARFTVKSGIIYVVRLESQIKDLEPFYSLSFRPDELSFDRSFYYTRTNENDALKIYSTVFKIVSEFAYKLKRKLNKTIYIGFTPWDDGQIKLYSRMVKNLASKFGFEVHTRNPRGVMSYYGTVVIKTD